MIETHKSHFCCFEQGENPDCGLKGIHRCCICEKEVQRHTSEKENKPFEFTEPGEQRKILGFKKETSLSWAEEWKKKFDEKFIRDDGLLDKYDGDSIKDFIRTEIEAEAQKSLMSGRMEGYHTAFSAGREAALEEVKKVIEQQPIYKEEIVGGLSNLEFILRSKLLSAILALTNTTKNE